MTCAPISLYLLGSSGGLCPPQGPPMSMDFIAVAAVCCSASPAAVSGRGAWLLREMRQPPAYSQKGKQMEMTGTGIH